MMCQNEQIVKVAGEELKSRLRCRPVALFPPLMYVPTHTHVMIWLLKFMQEKTFLTMSRVYLFSPCSLSFLQQNAGVIFVIYHTLSQTYIKTLRNCHMGEKSHTTIFLSLFHQPATTEP